MAGLIKMDAPQGVSCFGIGEDTYFRNDSGYFLIPAEHLEAAILHGFFGCDEAEKIATKKKQKDA